MRPGRTCRRLRAFMDRIWVRSPRKRGDQNLVGEETCTEDDIQYSFKNMDQPLPVANMVWRS